MTTYRWGRVLKILVGLSALGCDPLHAGSPTSPQGFQSSMPFKHFEEGERVAFLGDSITASGHYVHMIRLFYATRFPDRQVRLYNCGIGGASARSSWPRLDADCLDLDPTRVVIMLGMNDTGGGIRNDKDYMAHIMDRVSSDPQRHLALIVSSPYDQTAQMAAKNQAGKNDTIRAFDEWLVAQGREHKVPVIDFNTPMLRVKAEHQTSDPACSVVGPDRIHPGIRGHTVMTYCFLRAQDIAGPVACVEIDARTGLALTVNANVERVKAGDRQAAPLGKSWKNPARFF